MIEGFRQPEEFYRDKDIDRIRSGDSEIMDMIQARRRALRKLGGSFAAELVDATNSRLRSSYEGLLQTYGALASGAFDTREATEVFVADMEGLFCELDSMNTMHFPEDYVELYRRMRRYGLWNDRVFGHGKCRLYTTLDIGMLNRGVDVIGYEHFPWSIYRLDLNLSAVTQINEGLWAFDFEGDVFISSDAMVYGDGYIQRKGEVLFVWSNPKVDRENYEVALKPDLSVVRLEGEDGSLWQNRNYNWDLSRR